MSLLLYVDNLSCTLIFICDRLLNYLRSVLNIITRYYQYTVAHCQFFKVKEIGKKGKYLERGDWDINGGGGGKGD